MRIGIFKVILLNSIEEKYQSTGYLYVNIHWIPTLSTPLNKAIL